MSKNIKDIEFTKSSGNLFKDAGYNRMEAKNLQFRSYLMTALRKYILSKGWSQMEAAERLEVTQPRISNLIHGKIDLFSSGVLIEMLEKAGFEIASTAELDLLLNLGVPAGEIYFSNPIKSSAYIKHAAAKGVEWYALDSVEELRKIIKIAPNAKMYLRIDTPNIGSDWPLAGKFGTHLADIQEIIEEAARLNADLAGVTFHVGSQCRNPQNW